LFQCENSRQNITYLNQLRVMPAKTATTGIRTHTCTNRRWNRGCDLS